MKKSVGLFLVLSLVVFSVGFSSAGWFSDLFGKITGNVVSENLFIEQTLRGPANWSVANADCLSKGMRLPTWEEASSLYNNQLSNLTNPNYRVLTSTECSTGREYWLTKHAVSYRGLNYNDYMAKNPENNCAHDEGLFMYQCVVSNNSNGGSSGNQSSGSNSTVPTCTDSDGGLNYYVSGSVSTGNAPQQNYTDICFVNSSSSGMIPIFNCTGSNCFINEGYCVDDDNVGSYWDLQLFKCSGNCVHGACVNSTKSISIFYNSSDQQFISNISDALSVLGISTKLVQYINSNISDEIFLFVNGDKVYIVMRDYDSSYLALQVAEAIASKLPACEEDCEELAVITVFYSEFLNIVSPQFCQSTINLMQNPTDLVIDGRNWVFRYDYSWKDEYTNEAYYYASWHSNDDYSYNNVWASVSKLSDKDSVRQRLEDALQSGICEVSRVYSDYETETYKNVYVCKNIWRIADENQQVSQGSAWNYDNDVVAIWFNDNLFFSMEFSSNEYYSCYDQESCDRMDNYNHQRRQEDLINAIDNIINNENEYTSAGYLDYRSEQFVKYFLGQCGSEVKDIGYEGTWQCRMDPAVCPPHGEQKQLCFRNNYITGQEETREATMSCNPGLCSGCMVPKWFGSNWESKCIPYGFRFEQQSESVDQETFYSDGNTHGGDLQLEITGANSAYLKFGEGSVEGEGNASTWTWSWVAFEGNIEQGQTYYFSWPRESAEQINSGYFTVDEIMYSSKEGVNSYIVLSIKVQNSLNAYCDIDGQVKQQKTQSWGSCQNNYECDSNLCSYGECVDLKAIAGELQGFRGFLVRMLCRISNPFSEDGYNQCLFENQ